MSQETPESELVVGNLVAARRGPIFGLRARLTREARKAGHSQDDIDATLADMQQGKSLLDWFLEGGWEKLLEAFLLLLTLMADERRTTQAEEGE